LETVTLPNNIFSSSIVAGYRQQLEVQFPLPVPPPLPLPPITVFSCSLESISAPSTFARRNLSFFILDFIFCLIIAFFYYFPGLNKKKDSFRSKAKNPQCSYFALCFFSAFFWKETNYTFFAE
jgi:hypothetical protein